MLQRLAALRAGLAEEVLEILQGRDANLEPWKVAKRDQADDEVVQATSSMA